MANILITGGTGFIGSHFTIEALSHGHTVVLIDNLSNSTSKCLERIERITGIKVPFYEGDLREKQDISTVFEKHLFDAVVHFAALKSVPLSISNPLLYEQNNVGGTLNLLECMEKYGVVNLIFSSSATVYGNPKEVPILETADTSYTNPYGHTKLMIEQICQQLCIDPKWHIILLRYFNPIGAHPSGLLGEVPQGTPGNLMPNILQAAAGIRSPLMITGNDYATPDGTGVRDYIHIQDIVAAHARALEKISDITGCTTLNLGTGTGYSVLEVIKMIEEVSGKKIVIQFTPRRSGDIATCYADPTKASTILGWKTKYNLRQMCEDSWRFFEQNPLGY